MKRVMLAILILVTGTTVFCALRHTTVETKREFVSQMSNWQAQTQRLAQLRIEKEQVVERWTEAKQALAAQPPLHPVTQLAEKILSGAALDHLSAVESEQLLAELGFNWNTTGDYLVVSKSSLAGIMFDALKDVKLAAAARAVLAITPAEQTAVETMIQQLNDTRISWAKANVQRTEPSGNILAQYSLSVDRDFSRNQLAIFTNGIFSVLGPERAQSLQGHSIDWMTDIGLRTGPEFTETDLKLYGPNPAPEPETSPTTLTVERYQSGGEWRVNFTIKQAGSSMTTSVSPRQPFPGAFRALFPGGWEELAQREGFALPKEFQKK